MRGRKGSVMSLSENSLKIHWLQINQNPSSAGALPRIPLRELAMLPLLIPFLRRGFRRLDIVSAPTAPRFIAPPNNKFWMDTPMSLGRRGPE